MEVDQIPEQLQIDAALTNRLWNLVHRFCHGAWGELPFWLLETDTGYVVSYTERGVRTDHEEFADPEPAFRHWLRQTLRSHLLQIDSHP